MLLSTLLLLSTLCLSTLQCIHLVILSHSASDQSEVLGYLQCGIHPTSVDFCLLWYEERNTRKRSSWLPFILLYGSCLHQSRWVISWVSSFSLLSRRAVVWRGEQKQSIFHIVPNSWRLHWKLISTLEARVVPGGHCTTRIFSCSSTALFFCQIHVIDLSSPLQMGLFMHLRGDIQQTWVRSFVIFLLFVLLLHALACVYSCRLDSFRHLYYASKLISLL